MAATVPVIWLCAYAISRGCVACAFCCYFVDYFSYQITIVRVSVVLRTTV